MDREEFDASLGGTEQLPFFANSLKFAASRSVEIAAMTESILRPSKTKLIFQTLPVHMRRRVMSHNCKRLPRKLREGHLEQLKKSGLPPKQKRPSRKYRRRPTNLLEEYNRRKRQNAWLETHIWHAKRFHMINRWGYRLPHAPCDKAFRACYRASSAHCLMQDISYCTSIQIIGPLENVKKLFSSLTSNSCGLGVCAKAYTNGYREGSLHLYNDKSFPFGYIGKINFIWASNSEKSPEKVLWLFVHPALTDQVRSTISNLLCSFIEQNKSDGEIHCQKRRKLENELGETLKIYVLPGKFNRFRLTGPNSHAVLVNSLKCIDDTPTEKGEADNNNWISKIKDKPKLHLKEKYEFWQNLTSITSPAQLPPSIVVGLIVRDPRLSRPTCRTKARLNSKESVQIHNITNISQTTPLSPLWDNSIHETVTKNKLTNRQFIEHVTKTQIVPGEVVLDDPVLQPVPVVIIQQPGSNNSDFKKVGYGSGWDIIMPSGYGLAFWQTFIMFGARSGGVREAENLAFEMGECYLPPDSQAGKEEEKRIESELKEAYFNRPPSKRVNYVKLAINSPFICNWKTLLQDWSDTAIDDYFVLRDKFLLRNLQECINLKKSLPKIQNSTKCLVAIYARIKGKGNLRHHAIICLPKPGDITNPPLEPHHEDKNEKLRRQKKLEHIKSIKRWRRKRMKLKKTNNQINKTPKQLRETEPSEYVKTMRELWLPSKVETVRNSASREMIGYLTQGGFSLTEAKSCGVGYVAYNALCGLLNIGYNQALIRNTTSRVYRLAEIKII